MPSGSKVPMPLTQLLSLMPLAYNRVTQPLPGSSRVFRSMAKPSSPHPTDYLLRLVRLMIYMDHRNLQLKWNRQRFSMPMIIRLRVRDSEEHLPRRLREPRGYVGRDAIDLRTK